jgi:cell division protein FtsL
MAVTISAFEQIREHGLREHGQVAQPATSQQPERPRLTDVTRSTVRQSTTKSAPRTANSPSRAAGVVVAAAVVAILLMLVAAVLHTQLAERQFRIDNLDRSVRTEQARFAVLRSERAELRSPTRLAEAARSLGMSPAKPSQFIEMEPMELARAIAAGGALNGQNQGISEANPLEQFLIVKVLRNEP